MLKFCGVCFVLLGSSGLGWYIAGRYATRIRMLREFEQSLQFLYGEIAYSACDIVELFEKLAEKKGYFGAFWNEMSESLQQFDGQCLEVHWKENLSKVESVQNLTREDLELFYKIGQNIGNLDRQTQLHTIELFQKRLCEIIDRAKCEYRGKAKISCVVGMTMGAFVVLVLV